MCSAVYTRVEHPIFVTDATLGKNFFYLCSAFTVNSDFRLNVWSVLLHRESFSYLCIFKTEIIGVFDVDRINCQIQPIYDMYVSAMIYTTKPLFYDHLI